MKQSGKQPSLDRTMESVSDTKYRDSGIAWLGSIPSHWRLARMRHVSQAISGGTPSKENPDYWNGDVPWVSPKDMKRRVIDSAEDTITETAVAETGLKMIEPGSILIVVRGMILAHSFPVAITSAPVTINQDMKAIRFHEEVDPQYAAWYLTGVGKLILASIVEEAGHGTRVIRMDEWKSVSIPVPPIDEQSAIVRFLDTETEAIDRVIAKHDVLLELLAENCETVLTLAVSLGVDGGSAKRKSDNPALDLIPAHWSSMRLRHLLSSIEQGWSPECENREALPAEWAVLKAGCVNGGVFNACEHKALPPDLTAVPALEVKEGDLLMSRASGSRELVGSIAVVPACREKLILWDKVFRLHVIGTRMDTQFLAMALSSRVGRNQIENALSGGSGLANNIPQSVVKEILVPVPPLNEQQRIVSHVNTRLEELGRASTRAVEMIRRLREMRAALVTAAVTGKLDLRTRTP